VLDLDELQLEFRLKGVTYKIDYPTSEIYESLMSDLNNKETKEDVAFNSFMSKLGFKEETMKLMSIPQMRKLIKALVEGK